MGILLVALNSLVWLFLARRYFKVLQLRQLIRQAADEARAANEGTAANIDEVSERALLYVKLRTFISAACDYATIYDFRHYMDITGEKWEERKRPKQALKHIADYLDRLADRLNYGQIDHDFHFPDSFTQFNAFNWPIKK